MLKAETYVYLRKPKVLLLYTSTLKLLIYVPL